MDTIAGWTQAELRRFIVNTVLSDPANVPAPELPPGGRPGQLLTQLITGNLGWLFGGASLIYDNELTAPAASIDTGVTLPATFKHLLVTGWLRGAGGAGGLDFGVQFNGDVGNYQWVGSAAFSAYIKIAGGNYIATAGEMSAFAFIVPNYAHTSVGGSNARKTVTGIFTAYLQATGTVGASLTGGRWHNSPAADAPITRLVIVPSANNIDAESRVSIYGLN